MHKQDVIASTCARTSTISLFVAERYPPKADHKAYYEQAALSV